MEDKYQQRDKILGQVLSYLDMAKEKKELGDNEGEKYWRERTLERRDAAFLGPEEWNSILWELL